MLRRRSALLNLLKFAAVSNIQMSTFSPLAYRIQTGPLSRRVRFARIVPEWTRCARVDRMLVCEVHPVGFFGTRSTPASLVNKSRTG